MTVASFKTDNHTTDLLSPLTLEQLFNFKMRMTLEDAQNSWFNTYFMSF